MAQPTRRAKKTLSQAQALFSWNWRCFFQISLLVTGAGTPPWGSTRVTEPSK